MKKVYHLHIPKTGGRFLSDATISFLNYDCQLNNIDPRYSLITNHGGWNDVDDDTYIYTTFRNPVHRAISHYIFYRPYLEMEDTLKIKEQIFDFLCKPENEYMNDYQTKFITTTEDKVEEMLDTDFAYDMSKLDERLNRINFIVKSEDLSDDYVTEIYKQSCDWLGITPSQNKIISPPEEEENFFRNAKSKEVINSLTLDERDELIRLNSRDWVIYNKLINSQITV